jgi:hypothetical protein
MCRLCGREACAECFAKVRELTQYRPGASDSEIATLQAKRESHAHTNPFFLSCTRRNEHQYSDFSPMSRFDKTELEGVIESMEKLLQEETVTPASDPATVPSPPDGVVGGLEAATNTTDRPSSSTKVSHSTGGHDPPNDTVSVSWVKPGLSIFSGSSPISDYDQYVIMPIECECEFVSIECGENFRRVPGPCGVVGTFTGDSGIEWDYIKCTCGN